MDSQVSSDSVLKIFVLYEFSNLDISILKILRKHSVRMQRLEEKIKKTEEENSSGGLFSCCTKKNAIETQKREASQNAYVNTGKNYNKMNY